ncbi:glycoside hydrolase family 3 N-terminal domain-containing protein [Brachybacterium nesterenkovii]|uniref:Beta-glucosidase n=1 Tax=Brachybacterium nesterenkovii TaxID=47847 RepID=A0A1X6WSS1_9MICO|nr:glycoside hydrolase family 3 N-terminal domain-containing protein [Brachybacterium nesterenkovii]SLM87821.1 Beta-glucosidase [Brachybacterium nesterenkovii]
MAPQQSQADEPPRTDRPSRTDAGSQTVSPSPLSALTRTEKASLLSGASTWRSRELPARSIRAIESADGPHGLRKQLGSGDHLGLNASVPATCFPTASALASSWDVELLGEVGAALGAEAAAHGVDVLLGPGLNITRDPRCGRAFEYFSEDPHLAGTLAAAMVRGIQSRGVSACPKHFAVNSQETRRMASDSIVDERTLREIYLTAFEIVVRDARPDVVMSSYNRVNGTYAHENEHLLTQILREEWGFDGLVVSDWGGGNDPVAAAQAGGTLEMPSPGMDSVRRLLAALDDGTLDEADLDARAAEVIALAARERPRDAGRVPDPAALLEDHHALARRAAARSAVLLKNDPAADSDPAASTAAPSAAAGASPDCAGAGADAGDDPSAPLLPLATGTRIAVIGDMARTPRYQGTGSSQVNASRVTDPATALAAFSLEVWPPPPWRSSLRRRGTGATAPRTRPCASRPSPPLVRPTSRCSPSASTRCASPRAWTGRTSPSPPSRSSCSPPSGL